VNIFRKFVILIFVGSLFVKAYLTACAKLIWSIYFQIDSLESEIFEVPLSTQSEWNQIVIAHFITLTPGSLAIDLRDSKILVHALDRNSRGSLEKLIFEKLEPALKRLSKESPL